MWRIITHHLLFDQRFERIDLAIVAPLHELNLSKGTLADNLERGEVVGLFLGAQEAQVFYFGAAHAVLLADFAVVRNGRLLHQGLEFKRSTIMSVM